MKQDRINSTILVHSNSVERVLPKQSLYVHLFVENRTQCLPSRLTGMVATDAVYR